MRRTAELYRRGRERASGRIHDPGRIIDRATFEDPHRYADGVEYVLVNGVLVVDGANTPVRGRAGCSTGPGRR